VRAEQGDGHGGNADVEHDDLKARIESAIRREMKRGIKNQEGEVEQSSWWFGNVCVEAHLVAV
jgi:hypothetical protein